VPNYYLVRPCWGRVPILLALAAIGCWLKKLGMKNVLFACMLLCSLASCSSFRSLSSTTTIPAYQRFVLGDNEHGRFSATLRNLSNHAIEVYFAPIKGGTHSRTTIPAQEEFSTRVDANTALVIENKTANETMVSIKAKGDVSLGMGYQNLPK
jgi:hypothetical protein